jgi:hypothetical protein
MDSKEGKTGFFETIWNPIERKCKRISKTKLDLDSLEIT